MKIVDKFIVIPLDFSDKFGNVIESWLHFKGVGEEQILTKHTPKKTQNKSIQMSDYFINILKALSYIFLLPITIGCFIYREVRRHQDLAKRIALIEKDIKMHENLRVKINDEILTSVKEREEGWKKENGIIYRIANRTVVPEYGITDSCLVRIQNNRFRILSIDTKDDFLGELFERFEKHNMPVEVSFITRPENPQRFLKDLEAEFKVTSSTSRTWSISPKIV